MQVAPGRRHGGMPKRMVDEMDGCPTIEGMTGMGMAHPMGRDVPRDTGSPGCCMDNAQHLRPIKMTMTLW